MAPTESTASCRYPRLMAECVENYLSSSSAPSRPPEEVSHLDAGVGASPLLERVAPVGELATHVASEVRAATEIALTSLTEVNDGVEQLMAIVEVARGVLGETNRGGEFETLLAESGYLELSSSLRELTEESVAGMADIIANMTIDPALYGHATAWRRRGRSQRCGAQRGLPVARKGTLALRTRTLAGSAAEDASRSGQANPGCAASHRHSDELF